MQPGIKLVSSALRGSATVGLRSLTTANMNCVTTSKTVLRESPNLKIMLVKKYDSATQVIYCKMIIKTVKFNRSEKIVPYLQY